MVVEVCSVERKSVSNGESPKQPITTRFGNIGWPLQIARQWNGAQFRDVVIDLLEPSVDRILIQWRCSTLPNEHFYASPLMRNYPSLPACKTGAASMNISFSIFSRANFLIDGYIVIAVPLLPA